MRQISNTSGPRSAILALSLLLLLRCTPASMGPEQAGITLRILHINDTHSHFDATAAQVQLAADQVIYTYIGGHPRILTLAEQQRAQARDQGVPTLFLHGGDAFKGSAYFELFEHHINIDILNRMNLDAMALGNHEFDIGMDKLAEFVSQVNFPVLAGNVDTRDEPAFSQVALPPYHLFVQSGDTLSPINADIDTLPANTVAVMGLALEDMPGITPATGNLRFASEVITAQAIVDELTARGVQHIIALTHLGHQRDLRLAQEVNGIDVIVGGHSHSLLGDFNHWFLGDQAPYAQQLVNPDGISTTCVVQAGQFAQALGTVTVTFDSTGRLTACAGENTLLASDEFFVSPVRDESSRLSADQQHSTERSINNLPRTALIEEDRHLRGHLDTVYRPAVIEAYGRPLAHLTDTIAHVRLPGSDGSDQHGSRLALLIADAMHAWINQEPVQRDLAQTVDFTLIGAGNIRSPLQAGALHEGHITLEVLPFDTPLSVLRIRGDQLKELLTEVVAATLPPGAHAGKFPYSSHLRFTAQEQPGYRIEFSQLQVMTQGEWRDIVLDQTYTMMTTTYLADGNDGWGLLADIPLAQSRRIDVMINNNQHVIYPVMQLNRVATSDGQRRTEINYGESDTLPCSAPQANCKVAAQAFIDYLINHPGILHRPTDPAVTLLRIANDVR